ncbi:MAG: hypothetical protein HYY35_06655 [Deltaproteobacteria bacterium]|nr:hypothetical protein [Deltaproteobacteria bacterium]
MSTEGTALFAEHGLTMRLKIGVMGAASGDRRGACEEGKLIGVLMGTGGITGIVREILRICSTETAARVFYESDPQRLVSEMLRLYRTEHCRRPSCFCDETCECHMQHEESSSRPSPVPRRAAGDFFSIPLVETSGWLCENCSGPPPSEES